MTQDIIIIVGTIIALALIVARLFRRKKPARDPLQGRLMATAAKPRAAADQVSVTVSRVALTAEELAQLSRDERRTEALRPPPPPENPETAAAASWGDVTGLRLPIDMDYLNQKGERSQRRVVVFAAEGNQGIRAATGWASRFRGRCLLANEDRSFRVDGVQRLMDPSTGEVAEAPRDIARLLARRIEEEIAAGRGVSTRG